MAKVRITLSGTYDLLPEYYPEGLTLKQMMELDEKNENMGPVEMIESIGETLKIKFELVEE